MIDNMDKSKQESIIKTYGLSEVGKFPRNHRNDWYKITKKRDLYSALICIHIAFVLVFLKWSFKIFYFKDKLELDSTMSQSRIEF